MRRTGYHQHDCEDLTQEVFLKLARRRAEEGIRDFAPYLFHARAAAHLGVGPALVGTGPQDNTAPATSSAAPPVLAAATGPNDREIIVTGSRVIRNGNAAPQPITVVQASDLLATQPTTLADGLNNLPIFTGFRGQQSSTNGTNAGAGGNSNANQLNLRNLGPQRGLILMDGQRLPPALYNGTVDVDIVPEMLITRIDTVTGGVSAVYGSDAVSTVV